MITMDKKENINMNYTMVSTERCKTVPNTIYGRFKIGMIPAWIKTIPGEWIQQNISSTDRKRSMRHYEWSSFCLFTCGLSYLLTFLFSKWASWSKKDTNDEILDTLTYIIYWKETSFRVMFKTSSLKSKHHNTE